MLALRKHTDSVMRLALNPRQYYLLAEKIWGINGKYDIHLIETSNIRRWSGRDRSTRHDPSTIGAIWDGDWDKMTPRFSNIVAQSDHQFNDSAIIEESIFYKSFIDRFINKQPWEETALIKMFDELLEKHGQLTWPSYRTKKRIDEKCNMLDQMYHNFLSGRVESQRQRLVAIGKSIPIWKGAMQEVLLDQSRDGEYLLMDGRHRTMLAKIAGVKYIPAIIAVRHRKLVY